jgi:hypothetical protein
MTDGEKARLVARTVIVDGSSVGTVGSAVETTVGEGIDVGAVVAVGSEDGSAVLVEVAVADEVAAATGREVAVGVAVESASSPISELPPQAKAKTSNVSEKQ